MKRIFGIVMLLLISLILSGCNLQSLIGNLTGGKEKTSSKSSQKEEKKIIAVALNEEDPNKDMFLLGIQEMAEKEDLEVKVLTQKDQGGADTLKDAKVLIYQAGEKSTLKKADEDKIPILALNKLPSDVKAKGIVLPDPEQVGNLMAQQVKGKVSEGEVVYLQGEADDPVAQLTLAAFRRELGGNPKLTVHSITNPPESEPIAIQGLMEYLEKNPDKVKVICAQNEKLAAQAYELLKSIKLKDKIQLMGGQANPNSLKRIASGGQIADIDTAPYVQGVNAFQWAQKLMDKQSLEINESITGDKGEVAAKIIPVKTVTSENLALIQKSYTKAAEAQKELEQKKADSKDKGKEDKSKDKEESPKKGDGDQGNQVGNGKQSNEQGQASSSQGQGVGTIPQGVKKVTEKIRTEITREYLDEKGNVLGTEKSANDQVRTIPPEMLLQEQQQKQEQKQQGDQEQKKDSGKSDKGEGGSEDEKGT